MFGLKKKASQPVLQHIAFPVEVFDALQWSEKERNHTLVNRDGWSFSLRAFGWIVMSRISAEAIPDHKKGGLYGVREARPFSEAEFDALRLKVQLSVDNHLYAGLSHQERKLKKPFEDFAREQGLDRENHLRVLRVMRHVASQGVVVGYDDLDKHPFRRLGNVRALLGARLNQVIDFQNRCAKSASEHLG